MLNKNLTITLEHIIEAERGCQSLTPESGVADPGTQLNLPERILLRAREEASAIGISPEVLIIALLQVFQGADQSVKIGLANELERLRHPGSA